MNGQWVVQLYDGTKRKTLNLGTTDYDEACQRFGEGHRELLARIRRDNQIEEHKTYSRDEPATVWEVPRGMEPSVENLERYGVPVETIAAEVLEDHQLTRLTWEDLAKNANSVRLRKTGQGYTQGWWQVFKYTMRQVPFQPEGLTVEMVYAWNADQERKGIGAQTRRSRCSLLQGLIERAIKNGYRRDLAPNVFKLIDYSTQITNHYWCPQKEDYQKYFQWHPKKEKQQVFLDLLCFTGVRSGALKYIQYNEPGWLFIPDVDGTKGGAEVPCPLDIWHAAKAIDVLPLPSTLNVQVKDLHPEWVCHSFRSGFKMLSRLVGLDHMLGESLLAHKLPGLEQNYGGEVYPKEALLVGAEKIWAQLNAWHEV